MSLEKKDYLFNLLDDLNILYNTLKNNKKLITQEYNTLLKDIAVYKTRINYDPDVKMLLDILQKHEHEKSVGAYERLLSALLQDVLPGEREIVMALNTERGVSSLNINVRKGENPLEDPYSGNGGSVANILSVGLRLIALIRSGKRRFMMLDEADCWMRAVHIPKFAKVIKEMSENMGVQIVMISHNDEKHFSSIPHKLNINKTDFGIETEWSIDSELPFWNDEDTGFRSILLSNFQSHSNTFIPLSPNVTLLVGDNDIGKSSVVAALRAIFYGESDDSMIKHYEPSTKVTIEMGQGKALFWERKFGKGSPKDPKEVYTLIDMENGYDLDNPLHRTEGAKYLPEWLEEEIGIGLIDGLDVQIGHQKKPVFLLDQPGSVRAKALAIGSDSSYVQKMMKISKDEMSEAKTSIKNAEKNLERFQRNLLSLKTIEDHADFFETDALKSYKRKIDYLNDFLEKYSIIKNKWEECLFLKDSFEILDHTPAINSIPELEDLKPYRKLSDAWSNYININKELSLLESINPSVEVDYDFNSSSKLKELLIKWKNSKKECEKYKKLSSLNRSFDPELNIETKELNSILKKWKYTRDKVNLFKDLDVQNKTQNIELENNEKYKILLDKWNELNKDITDINADLETVKKEEESINNIIMKEFPICPTCKRPWDSEHKD